MASVKSAMAFSPWPSALKGHAPAVIGVGEFRVQADGLGEIGDGLLLLALDVVGDAAVVIRLGEFRLLADGLVIVGDGLVQLARGPVGAAAAIVGRGAIRVQADGLGVIVEDLVELAFSPVGAGPIAVGRGPFRVDLDGLGEGGNGGVVVLFLEAAKPLPAGLGRRIGAGRGGGQEQDCGQSRRHETLVRIHGLASGSGGTNASAVADIIDTSLRRPLPAGRQSGPTLAYIFTQAERRKDAKGRVAAEKTVTGRGRSLSGASPPSLRPWMP